MSTAQLNIINASIRELLKALDDLKRGRTNKDNVLRHIDELENHVDVMLSQLAPERITDERFNAAVRAVKEVTGKFRKLREAIIFGRYSHAKSIILDVQEGIREAFRLLTLIKAGAPTTLIFQVAPQFLREAEVAAPEALVYLNPMAAQIYNILLRKGEASVDELALELKIDDKSRDDFNRALSYLISTGYARIYYTPDNRMVLRPARR